MWPASSWECPRGIRPLSQFLIMTFPRVQVNIVGPAGNMTRIKPRLPNMIKGKDGMPVGI
jgi:hypothetical protein